MTETSGEAAIRFEHVRKDYDGQPGTQAPREPEPAGAADAPSRGVPAGGGEGRSAAAEAAEQRAAFDRIVAGPGAAPRGRGESRTDARTDARGSGRDEGVARAGRPAAAVEDLSFEVRPRELLALVGPSGCGKSTTLRMANRLVEPTSGRILLEGEDVTRVDPVGLRRRIGYVIQDVGLFPHRTIAQNVGTVPGLLGWDRRRTADRTAELITLVGLDPARYGKRYPHQLSGGERQRVGVARALAAGPPVLLMDEPFGAVDPVGRRRLQDEFLKLHRELGTTVMLVTHDIDEAVRMADRVLVLSRGARVEQLAPPLEVVARPASPAVADLVGRGRTTRLLGLTRLEPDDLWPATAQDVAAGAPQLDLASDLGEVLTALVAAPDGRVVLTRDGRPVGAADPDVLLRALRRHGDHTA